MLSSGLCPLWVNAATRLGGGKSDSLAAKSNHYLILQLIGQNYPKTPNNDIWTAERQEVDVRYGARAKDKRQTTRGEKEKHNQPKTRVWDNRCSHPVIFGPQNKNSVSGMKNWLRCCIDSAALWAINHSFQYFSTPAPHRGQAWSFMLEQPQRTQLVYRL